MEEMSREEILVKALTSGFFQRITVCEERPYGFWLKGINNINEDVEYVISKTGVMMEVLSGGTNYGD